LSHTLHQKLHTQKHDTKDILQTIKA